ncbi:MAG TPA: RidA family protein [Burkholderiaceae bacterium]
MNASSDSRLEIARRAAAEHGYDLDEPVLAGGRYAGSVEHEGIVCISGQVPRIGTAVVATGRVGDSVSLAAARAAARICTLRALAIVHQRHGLDRVQRLLRVNVYVRSDPTFTQHSEVADAASDLLAAVFGAEAGAHARTSVGVYTLPKDAAVELDLTLALIRP